MYKNLAKIIILFFVINNANASVKELNSSKEIYISSSLVGDYLSGDYAYRSRDVFIASEIYQRAISQEPSNPFILYNAYNVLLSNGEIEKAVKVSRQYMDFMPMPSGMGVLLATEAVKRGDYGNAEIVLDSVANKENVDISTSVNGVIVPFLKLWTKIGRGQYDESKKYSKNILGEGRVPSMFLSYQTAIMADISGDSTKALKGYQKITSPDNTLPYHFAVAAGNFYERAGQAQMARDLYERYNKQFPELNRFANRINKMKGDDKRPEKLISSATEGYAEVLKEAVRVLYNSGYYDEGLKYLRLSLFLNGDDDEAKTLLAKYHENNEQYLEAIKVHKTIDEESDFYLTSRVNIAEDLFSLDKKKAAIKTLYKLKDKYPDSKVVSLTLADLLRQSEEFLDAAEVYGEIINKNQTSSLKDWPIFFARGICYERAGKWREAEDDLMKALELKPNQPEVLNYLGYSWIDRNHNIEEARKMVEKAVRARPDDAQIIDSMGWVLYKIKEFDAASKFLEKASEITPYDAVINDHLGDIYWRQGRLNEAVYQWKRVLKYNNSPDISENDIKDKIKNGLPALDNEEG